MIKIAIQLAQFFMSSLTYESFLNFWELTILIASPKWLWCCSAGHILLMSTVWDSWARHWSLRTWPTHLTIQASHQINCDWDFMHLFVVINSILIHIGGTIVFVFYCGVTNLLIDHAWLVCVNGIVDFLEFRTCIMYVSWVWKVIRLIPSHE